MSEKAKTTRLTANITLIFSEREENYSMMKTVEECLMPSMLVKYKKSRICSIAQSCSKQVKRLQLLNASTAKLPLSFCCG